MCDVCDSNNGEYWISLNVNNIETERVRKQQKKNDDDEDDRTKKELSKENTEKLNEARFQVDLKIKAGPN